MSGSQEKGANQECAQDVILLIGTHQGNIKRGKRRGGMFGKTHSQKTKTILSKKKINRFKHITSFMKMFEVDVFNKRNRIKRVQYERIPFNITKAIRYVFNRHFCACGCGKLANEGRRYILKHKKEGIQTVIGKHWKWRRRSNLEIAIMYVFKPGPYDSRIGMRHSKEKGIKISNSLKGITRSVETRIKQSNRLKGSVSSKKNRSHKEVYGREKAEEIRRKISSSLYGTMRTKESIEKTRIGMMMHRKNRELVSVGKYEKEILDEIETRKGIKIERTYPVFGYFVDGYCEETNTVYEVDEEYHRKEMVIIRDLERQKKIEEYLQCKFIRIDVKKWLDGKRVLS